MSEMSMQDVDLDFLSPRTPPPPRILGEDAEDTMTDELADDNASNSGGKSKRRRRAKGRKRKNQSSLMITNEDGTDFTGSSAVKQSKINLRPTNNPLLNAPKNSTQFIIDDHENSNLFWNFEAGPDGEVDQQMGRAGQFFGEQDNERYSPDDESFWTEYSARDFEDVYENAHQEEIYGWEKERIVREIAEMEGRQKKLIEMLAAIDPVIYLEKLQHELISLQEVNKKLKLINIAERLHRQERANPDDSVSDSSNSGSDSDTDTDTDSDSDSESDSDPDSDSDSRLPDSTSQEGEARDEDEVEDGGCSSGCCLADPCDEGCLDDQRLSDVEDQEEDQDNDPSQNLAIRTCSSVQSNPDPGSAPSVDYLSTPPPKQERVLVLPSTPLVAEETVSNLTSSKPNKVEDSVANSTEVESNQMEEGGALVTGDRDLFSQPREGDMEGVTPLEEASNPLPTSEHGEEKLNKEDLNHTPEEGEMEHNLYPSQVEKVDENESRDGIVLDKSTISSNNETTASDSELKMEENGLDIVNSGQYTTDQSELLEQLQSGSLH